MLKRVHTCWTGVEEGFLHDSREPRKSPWGANRVNSRQTRSTIPYYTRAATQRGRHDTEKVNIFYEPCARLIRPFPPADVGTEEFTHSRRWANNIWSLSRQEAGSRQTFRSVALSPHEKPSRAKRRNPDYMIPIRSSQIRP